MAVSRDLIFLLDRHWNLVYILKTQSHRQSTGAALSRKSPMDQQRSGVLLCAVLKHHKTLEGQCSSGKQ